MVKRGSENGAESLAEYVRRVRKGRKLSNMDVQKNSRRGGAEGVTDGYVSAVENGRQENLTVAKLMALAKGLGLGRTGEDELFAAARGVTAPQGFTESWFHELYESYLSLLEQRHVAELDSKVQELLKIVHNGLDDLQSLLRGYPKKAEGPGDIDPIRRKRLH